MPRRGRPPKLTAELAVDFCRLVGGGLSRAKAAAAVGVTPKTICLWLKAGRDGRGPTFVHFVHEVRAAEARFVADQLAVVVRAAGPRTERVTKTITRPDGTTTVEVTEWPAGDWRAAVWLLQCKDAEAFGSDRHELRAVRKELAELRQTLAAIQGSTASGVATDQG